jgi:hypothetical protein
MWGWKLKSHRAAEINHQLWGYQVLVGPGGGPEVSEDPGLRLDLLRRFDLGLRLDLGLQHDLVLRLGRCLPMLSAQNS